MYGCINGFDFGELEPMRYWAPPSSWTDEKKRDNAHTKIYSGDFLGSEKKDGYFAKLVKDEDGNVGLYSRSRNVKGEFPEKSEWVPHLKPFFDALPNGTCLLGELYLPSAPGSRNITSLMGCLKEKAIARQESGEKLHFYVFDCLAYNGTNYVNLGAETRFRVLFNIEEMGKFDYVSYAVYFSGQTLWMKLQEILGRGDEGIVITHRDGKYEPGKRPSKTTLKIKKELKQTIDCFFTGRGSAPTKEYTGKELETWQYWIHEVTGEKIQGDMYRKYSEGAPLIPVTKGYFNGWCGSLEIAVLRKTKGKTVTFASTGEVLQDTEVFPIGWLSGLPDEMKTDPKKYAYKPIEVTAMEYDDLAHSLRHGKMVGWRKDLTIKDCTLEKIEG